MTPRDFPGARTKVEMNSKFFEMVSVLLLVFGFLNSALLAQSNGSISGRVLDQTNALIPGVTVDLTLPDSTVKSTLTDGQGVYRFEQIPTGRVEMVFRLINFSTVRRDVRIVAADTITMEVILFVSARADITVTALFTFRNVYNLFNQEAADIDYFYTSRLPGEPPEGIDDIHTHPALPRTLRVSLRVGF